MQEYLNDIMGQKNEAKLKSDLEKQKNMEFKNTGF